jgi:hypothetical protein
MIESVQIIVVYVEPQLWGVYQPSTAGSRLDETLAGASLTDATSNSLRQQLL